jgi:hypothetical protein
MARRNTATGVGDHQPQVRRLRWWESARCSAVPFEVFYAEDLYGDVIDLLCRRCPVRLQCLEEGLDDDHGVWGGTTPPTRRRMRKDGLTAEQGLSDLLGK